MPRDKIVYSTGVGRITPARAKPGVPRGDGVVRVRRETGGRGGKPKPQPQPNKPKRLRASKPIR